MDSEMEFKTVQDVVCHGLVVTARPFEFNKLVRELLGGLRASTGSERADLLLYQSDVNILFFSESDTGSGDDGRKGNLSLADSKNSAPVQSLSGGHTVLVEDVRDSGLLSLSSGTKTLLSIPVFFGDRTHGVLNLEHNEPNAYDSGTVRWIEALSGIFAMLLEHSFLSEQVFRLNQRLIDTMTDAADANDPGFKAHAERVSTIAVAIAEQLELNEDTVRAVRDSGYLHDIGKSGVSQSILVKPGSLTVEEIDEVRKHPILGRFLLRPLGFQPSVIQGVVSHHERWDGTGYPEGLKGDEIPITGRILAVAEAFDVMTSDQPYREKMSPDKAADEIKSHAGDQFDPHVVDALLGLDYAQL
jgi:putative nucleotidyltransferase with HDIG domain